jgi:hypothetical protein
MTTLLVAFLAAGSYAVYLQEPPVVERYPSRTHTEAAQQYRRKLEQSQEALKRKLRDLHVTITGSTQVLQNAIFIKATPERVQDVRRLPGVKGVTPMRRVRRL